MNKELRVATFRDLMNGQPTAEIVNLMDNKVVRVLTVNGDEVKIRPGVGDDVIVPMDMAIIYEPWALDRGSLLFGQGLKICTEMDLIRFPNGDTMTILPKV
jgi:hypothetical protein